MRKQSDFKIDQVKKKKIKEIYIIVMVFLSS